jgi:hypothetical protein
MHDLDLYEYAVIRLVPRVEREEFLNVGVILFCKRRRFLQARYVLDAERIGHFSRQVDLAELQRHLEALERICRGGRAAGPIGVLDAAERFRWLTAVRSTMLQTSRPHAGFCADLPARLEQLFRALVLDY